ncbi:MAG TPA: NAD(P)-dependent oxidoreductase [Persephonella sp.]|uniref:3-hydroxyisobutyrate dehydrogenase n=1 Tax=Persephonella marina (strain DSM 14350 / EX-H1) TaxID=123214 RepID=C0QQB8_PERMH|nr:MULTISPECIES: NAD(P)-dependent oxidoreductase [Persephonella]ACO04437.1 3-hydroxyisobutyrate dehydrogenase [Persephonella marina EX-H1]HCB69530.1 NAD(P)-dependent oxidoreductase [Persephonella sp.]
MSKKIGWIGLGHMGLPMATNLFNAGYDIHVWNRTLDKAKESGLPYKRDLNELVKEKDIIITMLFGSESVNDLYTRILKSGVDLKGKLFIDMTTVHPETARKVAEDLIKKGADFLEAPVLGSVIPAKKGILTIVVSGDQDKFDQNRDIFEVLGKEIFYMGDYGIASTMKLINNTVLGSFMAVLSEAFAFAKKVGIDPELALSVLENGAGRSLVLEAKKEKLLKEDYSTHFSVGLIHKDLTYAIDIAHKNRYPLFLTSVTRELFNSAKAYGLEDEDFCSVLEIFKKLSNYTD